MFARVGNVGIFRFLDPDTIPKNAALTFTAETITIGEGISRGNLNGKYIELQSNRYYR
jgi:hypothetical protein